MQTTYRYIFDKDVTGGIKLIPVTDVQTSNDNLSVESEEIIETAPTEQEQTTTETTAESEYQQKIIGIQTQQSYLLLIIAFGIMLLNGFVLARIVWRKI